MDIDRRRLFVVAGLIAVPGVNRPDPHRADITPDMLDGATAELENLAAEYEAIPAARTQARAWTLAASTGRLAPAAAARMRPDWIAVCARALVLRANAELDLGQTAHATRTALTAEKAASEIGDWPTVAHAHAVRAEVLATQRRWAEAITVMAAGHWHAGRSPVAVMLAGSEAVARAELGDDAGMHAALRRGQTVMDGLPADDHGPVGYSMDTYHPAQLASASARALVRAGDLDTARPQLDELRAQADTAGAVGLSTFARLMDARAAMNAGAPDGAREHLADAIVTAKTAKRPTAWLAEAAHRLAVEAQAFGVSLWDLAGHASA